MTGVITVFGHDGSDRTARGIQARIIEVTPGGVLMLSAGSGFPVAVFAPGAWDSAEKEPE